MRSFCSDWFSAARRDVARLVVDHDRQQHEQHRDREKNQRRRAEIRGGPRAAEAEAPVLGQQAAGFFVDGSRRGLGRGELAGARNDGADRDTRLFEQSGRGLEVRLRGLAAQRRHAERSVLAPQPANDLADVLSRVVEPLHRLIDVAARSERARALPDGQDRELEPIEGRPVGREIGRRQHAREVAGGDEQLRRKLEQTAESGMDVEQRLACAAERGQGRVERGPAARRRERSFCALRRALSGALLRDVGAARSEPVERRGVARDRPARVGPCGLRGHEQPAEPGVAARGSLAAEPKPRGDGGERDRKHDRDRRQHLRPRSRFRHFSFQP